MAVSAMNENEDERKRLSVFRNVEFESLELNTSTF